MTYMLATDSEACLTMLATDSEACLTMLATHDEACLILLLPLCARKVTIYHACMRIENTLLRR